MPMRPHKRNVDKVLKSVPNHNHTPFYHFKVESDNLIGYRKAYGLWHLWAAHRNVFRRTEIYSLEAVLKYLRAIIFSYLHKMNV